MIKKIFIISFFSLLIAGLIIYINSTTIRFDRSQWKQIGQLNQASYPRLKMADGLIHLRFVHQTDNSN